MIWITRSEPGAGRLATALQQAGFQVWCRPLIGIDPLESAELKFFNADATADPGAPDLVVVLSGHAADGYCRSPWVQRARLVRHIAVGEETGRLLTSAGLDVSLPEASSSEGILRMDLVQAIGAGQTVWLCSGRGGRDVLLDYFVRERECRVVKMQFYVRKPIEVHDIPVARIRLVVLASQAGLQAFAACWDRAAGGRAVQLLVPSARVAAAAGAMGFENVHNAGGAGVRDVLAGIARINLSQDTTDQ